MVSVVLQIKYMYCQHMKFWIIYLPEIISIPLSFCTFYLPVIIYTMTYLDFSLPNNIYTIIFLGFLFTEITCIIAFLDFSFTCDHSYHYLFGLYIYRRSFVPRHFWTFRFLRLFIHDLFGLFYLPEIIHTITLLNISLSEIICTLTFLDFSFSWDHLFHDLLKLFITRDQ